METWKEIPNYPKYMVSDLGNVKKVKSGKMLKPFDRMKYSPNKNQVGYMTVHLCNDTDPHRFKNHSMHSVVMLAFVGPRPVDYVINHINGNKGDNRLTNLEYCTVSYNRKQDFIMGRQSLRGEKNTQVKLTERQVIEILEKYKSGKGTYRSLAKEYGVHFCGISNILNGHCWSYLTGIKKRY